LATASGREPQLVPHGHQKIFCAAIPSGNAEKASNKNNLGKLAENAELSSKFKRLRFPQRHLRMRKRYNLLEKKHEIPSGVAANAFIGDGEAISAGPVRYPGNRIRPGRSRDLIGHHQHPGRDEGQADRDIHYAAGTLKQLAGSERFPD
jgi:hypothetical protein